MPSLDVYKNVLKGRKRSQAVAGNEHSRGLPIDTSERILCAGYMKQTEFLLHTLYRAC